MAATRPVPGRLQPHAVGAVHRRHDRHARRLGGAQDVSVLRLRRRVETEGQINTTRWPTCPTRAMALAHKKPPALLYTHALVTIAQRAVADRSGARTARDAMLWQPDNDDPFNYPMSAADRAVVETMRAYWTTSSSAAIQRRGPGRRAAPAVAALRSDREARAARRAAAVVGGFHDEAVEALDPARRISDFRCTGAVQKFSSPSACRAGRMRDGSSAISTSAAGLRLVPAIAARQRQSSSSFHTCACSAGTRAWDWSRTWSRPTCSSSHARRPRPLVSMDSFEAWAVAILREIAGTTEAGGALRPRLARRALQAVRQPVAPAIPTSRCCAPPCCGRASSIFIPQRWQITHWTRLRTAAVTRAGSVTRSGDRPTYARGRLSRTAGSAASRVTLARAAVPRRWSEDAGSDACQPARGEEKPKKLCRSTRKRSSDSLGSPGATGCRTACRGASSETAEVLHHASGRPRESRAGWRRPCARTSPSDTSGGGRRAWREEHSAATRYGDHPRPCARGHAHVVRGEACL